jgi:hypothetical protein
MTPFTQVIRNVAECQMYRDVLLAQPAEFFRSFFGGRLPSPYEKMHYIEHAIQRMTSLQVYQNDVYRVEIANHPPFVHLDIRRLDGQSCKEWRDFQRIKNELVGPDFEAVELFPAESRLVDTANQYHLWVHADPHYRFPFGFVERFVLPTPLRYDSSVRGEAAPPHENNVVVDNLAARVPQALAG